MEVEVWWIVIFVGAILVFVVARIIARILVRIEDMRDG